MARASRKKRPFDKYAVYEHAVQDPVLVMRNLARTFARLRGREARTMREDFCGTGANSEQWVLRHPDNRAVGVDLDEEPIAWAAARRFAPGKPAASRVKIVRGDVLDQKGGSFDAVVALNFSWMVFHERDVLLRYFERVRRSLVRDGVFWVDLYGGPDTLRRVEDHSRMGSYSYYWHQKEWEAIRGTTRCAIHFRMSDGIKRKNVFTYDWRLWSLSEVIDVLRDAGFSILEVQDEVSTLVGRGTSVWKPVKRLANSESFVANVFAGR